MDQGLARYQLLEVIGQGGMGTVYRAHDTVIDRYVAVKVLPTQLADEPGYRERFRREAYTVARLTEPHIVPIFDTGEADGQLYLVMPIIEGTDLGALLRREGPMSPHRAVHIIEQLAAALGAAHAVGLVHRDIKPSNALVTTRDFAYLIDFGIAHDATATKLTTTGMIVGTLAYMAPERFTTGVADSRGDVYALACVLHECLTGKQPYQGQSMEQQIAGHLSLGPPRPSADRPDIPVQFDHVIATGMAKDPDLRYQSADQLAGAARHALSDQPLHFAHSAAPATATRHAPHVQAGAPGPTNPTVAAPLHGAPVPVPTPTRRRFYSRPGVLLGFATAVVLIIVAALVVSIDTGGSAQSDPSVLPAAPPTPASLTPPSPPPAPVEEAALDGLLLDPDVVNTLLNTTGMRVTEVYTALSEFDVEMSPAACLQVVTSIAAKTYAGSGFTVVHGDNLGHAPPTPGVDQNLVLFPTAQDAYRFFNTAATVWAGCSNTNVKLSNPDDPNEPGRFWPIGPVANTEGTLSAGVRRQYSDGAVLTQRALAVANNVIIDIWVGGLDNDAQDIAAQVATQIAAKVPKT